VVTMRLNRPRRMILMEGEDYQKAYPNGIPQK